MSGTTTRDHYNYAARVTGRTVLARELQQGKWAAAAREAGLVPADLAFIQKKGAEAETYDRQLREQLAQQQQDIATVMAARDQVAAEEEHLRIRLPAVIEDLAADPATTATARWLAAVTFERYRIRVSTVPLPPDAPDDNVPPEIRARVLRRDRLSWAQSLAHFTSSLLETDRAAAVELLQARGLSRDRLQKLSDDAKTLVGKLGGKASLTAVEATRLEAAAVLGQKQRWHACRG